MNSFQSATVTGATASVNGSGHITAVCIQEMLEASEDDLTIWNMISCVAIVRSMRLSLTKITFILEDYSGYIEAHYWLVDDYDAAELLGRIKIHKFVEVYGCLRRNSCSENTLMVFKLLSDRNDIQLETPGEQYFTGMSPRQAAVYGAIRRHSGSYCGISVEELLNKFLYISHEELIRITDYLIRENCIYSTIDANHFLSTY